MSYQEQLAGILPAGEKVDNPELLQAGESRVSWLKVPEGFEPFIIGTFSKALDADFDKVRRIFNVANPHVIVGKNYWRIAPGDAVLLTRLLFYYIP